MAGGGGYVDNWMRNLSLQRLSELANFVDDCASILLLFIERNTSFEISLLFSLRSSQKVHFGLLSFTVQGLLLDTVCLHDTSNIPMGKVVYFK